MEKQANDEELDERLEMSFPVSRFYTGSSWVLEYSVLF